MKKAAIDREWTETVDEPIWLASRLVRLLPQDSPEREKAWEIRQSLRGVPPSEPGPLADQAAIDRLRERLRAWEAWGAAMKDPQTVSVYLTTLLSQAQRQAASD